MKKRAIVVMVCAIGFVASFVIIGYFGLTSTGMMERMYVSQSKQLVIGKEENGSWKAVLQDLACCEAEAETLEEVIEKANAALYDWIELELSEDEVNLPPISDPRDLEQHLKEGQQVRQICVNIRLFDGWDE